MTAIVCPKCKESFEISAMASVPKEQILYFNMKSESEMFSAETVGKAIVNMEKLQRGVAANMGVKVAIVIKSIDLKPHEITIAFCIAQFKDQ